MQMGQCILEPTFWWRQSQSGSEYRVKVFDGHSRMGMWKAGASVSSTSGGLSTWLMCTVHLSRTLELKLSSSFLFVTSWLSSIFLTSKTLSNTGVIAPTLFSFIKSELNVYCVQNEQHKLGPLIHTNFINTDCVLALCKALSRKWRIEFTKSVLDGLALWGIFIWVSRWPNTWQEETSKRNDLFYGHGPSW